MLTLSVCWTIYVLIMGVWILQQRRAPAATLGWLLSMAAMPVVGLGIYYVFGPQRLKRQRLRRIHSKRRWRMHMSTARLREKVAQAPERLHQFIKLINATSYFPLSTAEKVDLLVGGKATFESIFQAVQQAEHSVHLEYYIFEPDQTGLALMELLCMKAQEGVAVRLLVDALGSKRLNRKHYHCLEEAGGQVALFHPTKFGRRLRPVINFRSHRKIVVIDGRTGFTGGVNITDQEDESLQSDAFHDVHIRLQGPVVNWLQTVFLEDWLYAHGNLPEEVSLSLVNDLLPQCQAGDHAAQIIASGPDSHLEAIHRAHVAAIHMAHQRLWLTTPYFVPTEAAMLALTNAALRGVDVRLLVPQKSDSLVVTAAARSYFDELIRSGVKVYEYQQSMLHSKTMLMDEMVSIVGTANFDNRSFRLNYEVCAVIYGENFALQLEQQFLDDLRHAHCVPLGRKQHFSQRLFDSLARLMSPLL